MLIWILKSYPEIFKYFNPILCRCSIQNPRWNMINTISSSSPKRPRTTRDLRAHLIFPSPTILTFLPMGWKILIWQILTSFLPIVVQNIFLFSLVVSNITWANPKLNPLGNKVIQHSSQFCSVDWENLLVFKCLKITILSVFVRKRDGVAVLKARSFECVYFTANLVNTILPFHKLLTIS